MSYGEYFYGDDKVTESHDFSYAGAFMTYPGLIMCWKSNMLSSARSRSQMGVPPGFSSLSMKILIPGGVVYSDYAIGRFDLYGADASELKKSLISRKTNGLTFLCLHKPPNAFHAPSSSLYIFPLISYP